MTAGRLLLAAALVTIIITGCRREADQANNSSRSQIKQKRTIEQVMQFYTGEIMAIPGVNGLHLGKLENGRDCIAVMVHRRTEENEKMIPRQLEGFPVVIEETGDIRPVVKISYI